MLNFYGINSNRDDINFPKSYYRRQLPCLYFIMLPTMYLVEGVLDGAKLHNRNCSDYMSLLSWLE